MALRMHRVQVWSGELPDRPGGAAAKLELLARSGADLEFVFTRPHPHRPGTSVIFLAPIEGPQQVEAACATGLSPARDIAMLCIEGENRPGIGYEIMSRLAVAEVNLRGLSVSTVNHQFAAYLAFDNADDAGLAIRLLTSLM
jgi:hypothetical protein